VVVPLVKESVGRFRRKRADSRIRDEDILKATESPTKRELGLAEFDADIVNKVSEKLGQLGCDPLLDRRAGDVVASGSLVVVVSSTDRAVGLGRVDQEGPEKRVELMWRLPSMRPMARL